MMPVFYIPIGYPDEKSFFQLLDLLNEKNVSTLEIGIPVTEPYQDGPFLTKVNKDLLQSGLTKEKVIECLKNIKKKYQFRIVLMTYGEGITLFELDTIDSDLYDGILCVDQDLSKIVFPNQVKIIFPDMNQKLLQSQIEDANLFVYLASSSGKTGAKINL